MGRKRCGKRRNCSFGKRLSLEPFCEDGNHLSLNLTKQFQVFATLEVKPISLPNGKFLDWSKLKAFADDKVNVTEKLKFILERVENIVGKEKMLITSIFSFSLNGFKRLLFLGC